MKKRWIILCLLMVPLLASAQSFWEGSAALQRGDAAFENGLYAASNSFAPDTQIKVLNLDNGESTTATVSQGVQGQSDILVFLSPRAAEAIGITAGSIAQVRVTVLQSPSAAVGSAGAESTVNPDQDVNPAAAPGLAMAAPTEGATASQQQAAESNESAEDARILAEAEARHPQKQLFLPPREDQKFALTPQPAQQPAEVSQAAQPETPSVTGESGAPPQQPEVPLAEAQPESTGPQEATGSAAAQPPQGEPGAQLALPEVASGTQTETSTPGAAAPGNGGQVALQPPESPPEQTPQTVESPVQTAPAQQAAPAGGVEVVASLPKLAGRRDAATFYVQLGAYGTQQSAQEVALPLNRTYPVVVLAAASGGRQIYKVLVGPLNKAESGTLLPVFRFRGFRDAFVRRE